MQEKISFCLSSQTPLARFEASLGDLYDKYGEMPQPLPLKMLEEGEDYTYAPGGATRLIPPMLKAFQERGLVRRPHWVSLNPMGPETAMTETAILHSIQLDPGDSVQYGRFKESFWKNIHGVEQELIPKKEFLGYAKYNWFTSRKMLDLHSDYDFDFFFVHDFQLLQVGSMIGPVAPTIFRWHAPVEMEDMIPEWRRLLLDYLDDYDSVIVSCKKYEESLRKAGFDKDLYQLYPHIDPDDYYRPFYSEVRGFCKRLGIGDDDRVVLVVARLDPMKGQNIAVKGISHLARKYPDLKLLLVGDGGFSSTEREGLGLPKGLRWKQELDRLSDSLGVDDRVIFTGHISDKELGMAYTRADVVVLPPVLEGFGLTAFEGWEYETPTVVSSEAGVAELMESGENGYVFDPSAPEQLSEQIDAILSDKEHAEEIAEKGHDTAKSYHLDKMVDKLWEIIENVLER